MPNVRQEPQKLLSRLSPPLEAPCVPGREGDVLLTARSALMANAEITNWHAELLARQIYDLRRPRHVATASLSRAVSQGQRPPGETSPWPGARSRATMACGKEGPR